MRKLKIESIISIPIRTFLDIICMLFFIFAVKDTFEKGYLSYIKRTPNWLIYLAAIIACVAKSIPGSLHLVPLIHLRYVPAAIFDFVSLFALAMYFRNFTQKLHRKKILYGFALVYAFIQFLWILQVEQPDMGNALMKIDNIGFAVGLVAKTGILISLSIALIRATSYASRKEEDKLLRKLSFSMMILNIKDLANGQDADKKTAGMLEAILKECLSMLDIKLGYYASLDQNQETLTIKYASDAYANQVNYQYSVFEGMSGAAILNKKEQVNNRIGEKSDYKRFSSLLSKKSPTNVDENVLSAASFPVLIDEVPIGVYMFESDEERFFSDADINLLSALVSQAATAIINFQLVQELSLSRSLLNGLRHIDMLMTDKERNLEEILEFILDKALNLANNQIGNIALLDKSRGALKIVAEASFKAFKGETYKISNSVSGLAVTTKDIVHIPDFANDTSGLSSLYQNFTGVEINCELVIPLIVNDDVIGVFNTESPHANSFSKADIDRVEGFARQAAIAIHIFQLFAENRRHRESLSALAEIDLLILNHKERLSNTLDVILKKALEFTQKKHAEILLIEEQPNKEKVLVIEKSTIMREIGVSIPLKEKSICGISLKKKMIVYLPYVDVSEPDPKGFDTKDVYFPTEKEKGNYYAPISGMMRSELVLPLVVYKKTIGFLNIESELYNDFRPEDMNLLQNLALTSAIAIHNAQQFEKIREQNKELMNSISKQKVEWVDALGSSIYHRIGNSGGLIRTILEDSFENKQFLIDPDTSERLIGYMKDEAQNLIDSRTEIEDDIRSILAGETEKIDFKRVKEVVEKHESSYRNSLYKIEIKGLEKLKPIDFIPPLFYEIVMYELIQNAKKSMPKGGKIVILGEMTENDVIIHFQDFGCGISEENQKRIFEKDYTKWDNNQKGTGQGLALIIRTLKSFQGKIAVKSKLGHGSTFTITLPISE